jgi:hypothetical protein
MAEDATLAKLLIKLQLDMSDMKADAEQAKSSNDGLRDAIKNSWTELKSQYDMVQEYWGMIQQGLDATVGKTVEYAGQVRTLMREVGASAEDASKLIQAGDDVGISFQQIEAAMHAAIRNGIQPTMENMEVLADQYVSIQDPVERTRFLMENFGKTGAELGPLMEQGAAGIREAGKAAEESGLVMDEKAVKAAREYEIAMDNLNDTTSSLTMTIGNTLIPILTEAANTGMLLLNWNKNMDAALNEHNDHMIQVAGSYDEYVTEMNRAVAATGYFINDSGDYVDVLGTVIEKNFLLSESAFNVARSQQDTRDETDSLRTAFQQQKEPVQNLKTAYEDLKPSVDLVLSSTQELTKEMLFQKAAQDLDADAALELGRHMGVINELSYTMQTSLQKLREKYDSNKDGLIDAKEAAGGYTDQVKMLYDLYERITDKQVTISVETKYSESGADNGSHYKYGDQGYATGASLKVPDGYPADSYPMRMRVESGEKIDITPAVDVRRSDGAMNDLLNEIRGLREDLSNQRPSFDAKSLSRSIRDSILQVYPQ